MKTPKLTNGQAEVLATLKEYGPLIDSDLISVTRHVARSSQSHSGIRTRRKELLDLGLLREAGSVKMASGRNATKYATL